MQQPPLLPPIFFSHFSVALGCDVSAPPLPPRALYALSSDLTTTTMPSPFTSTTWFRDGNCAPWARETFSRHAPPSFILFL